MRMGYSHSACSTGMLLAMLQMLQRPSFPSRSGRAPKRRSIIHVTLGALTADDHERITAFTRGKDAVRQELGWRQYCSPTELVVSCEKSLHRRPQDARTIAELPPGGRMERMRFHETVLLEIIDERVVSSRGRQVPRGVKRKMSNYSIRPRKQVSSERVGFESCIRIVKGTVLGLGDLILGDWKFAELPPSSSGRYLTVPDVFHNSNAGGSRPNVIGIRTTKLTAAKKR
jgi:hypothetical protein